MKLDVFTIFSLAVLSVSGHGDGNWSYDKPEEWPGLCQTGKSQSPIDIVNARVLNPTLTAFKFTDYDVRCKANVTTTKLSTTITLNTSPKPKLSGGGLRGEYVFDHFHFHWQSEHTVNGKRHALEMHMVHHASHYDSVGEAAGKRDGLAVLTVIFEQLKGAKDFEPLVDLADKLTVDGSDRIVILKKMAVSDFFPKNYEHYYRYKGSLTTPNCDEPVTWIVFADFLPTSLSQVKEFEKIYQTDPKTSTYRPLQPLNRRRIFENKGKISAAVTVSASVLMTLLFCALPFAKAKL